ncbi:MAG: hypothetical protein ABI321_15540 [Polyangia bacterium]
MRSVPLAICILVLTCVQLRVAWLRLVGPRPLGPPLAARVAYATELVGQGLSCTSLRARARTRLCRDGPCGELSTERRLLLGAPLDPRRMSVRDWEALPHIGPARARALHDAFDARGAASWVERLRHVRGLGKRLAADLTTRLDVETRSDICSLGSWPTTSSGYDRLP